MPTTDPTNPTYRRPSGWWHTYIGEDGSRRLPQAGWMTNRCHHLSSRADASLICAIAQTASLASDHHPDDLGMIRPCYADELADAEGFDRDDAAIQRGLNSGGRGGLMIRGADNLPPPVCTYKCSSFRSEQTAVGATHQARPVRPPDHRFR